MSPSDTAPRCWKVIALIGAVFITVGMGIVYFYLASTSDSEFLTRNFDWVTLVVLGGVVTSFVGCIGWAKHRDKGGRVSMALCVFLTPWVALFSAA